MTDLIVVTGGRGRLGSAVVDRLHRLGASVLETDSAPIDSQDRRLNIGHDRSDVLSLPPVEYMTMGQPIGGLVCLHGLDAVPNSDASDPWRDWDDFLATNLTGTMNACKVFGSAMVEAGKGGSIVTVGSLYGVQAPDQRLYADGFVKPAGYAASKAGVIGFTRWLAAYWGQHNIRVNCLCPGGVTNRSVDPDFERRYSERVPLGRMATPEDVAKAVAWLISDESAYLTGQTIVLDGGASIW